jgi:hypothetical protein
VAAALAAIAAKTPTAIEPANNINVENIAPMFINMLNNFQGKDPSWEND